MHKNFEAHAHPETSSVWRINIVTINGPASDVIR